MSLSYGTHVFSLPPHGSINSPPSSIAATSIQAGITRGPPCVAGVPRYPFIEGANPFYPAWNLPGVAKIKLSSFCLTTILTRMTLPYLSASRYITFTTKSEPMKITLLTNKSDEISMYPAIAQVSPAKVTSITTVIKPLRNGRFTR